MRASRSGRLRGRIAAALVGALALGSVSLAASPSVAAPSAKHEKAVLAPSVLAQTMLTTLEDAPLRVGSYNVRCANCFDGVANEKHWADRRAAVVATILGADLDVVGVQEASQGRIHDAATGSRNVSQFEDLRDRLGGAWQVTNDKRYNCANSTSPNHCSYVYQGASDNNRIFYNSDRLTLLRAGATKLPSPKGKGDNYLAWAEFRQQSTGKRFVISDLHTVSEDKYASYKKRQAVVAAATLKANNPDKLPMVAVGDWNSSRFEKPSNGPYDAYRAAGFIDPLGGAYRTSHTAPGATVEKRIRTWLSSSNNWKRQAPAHRDWINGSYIDYIMTTKMRVLEWETVAKLDSKGRFIGVIPSDHNLIRATLWLP